MARFFIAVLLYFVIVSAEYDAEFNTHIIDMNPETHPDIFKNGVHIKAQIGQYLEVSCPQYPEDLSPDDTVQFYLHAYKRDEKSFKECNLTGDPILSCDTPFRPAKLTIKFQRRSPNPYGFTFEEDGTYYYLAVLKGETDCTHATPLKVDVRGAGVVVPPTMKLKTKSSTKKPPRTRSTTTTTAKTTTRKNSILTKLVNQANPQVGGGGNAASAPQHITLLISLLSLLCLWLNA